VQEIHVEVTAGCVCREQPVSIIAPVMMLTILLSMAGVTAVMLFKGIREGIRSRRKRLLEAKLAPTVPVARVVKGG
jgi:hypothetical protein